MQIIDFGIWIFALIIFGLTFIVDLKHFTILRRDEIQVLLGLTVVSIILFVDAMIGLILGLALLVLFYRTHEELLMKNGNKTGWFGSFRENDLMVTLEDYVTPSHLESAQSNTINANAGSKIIGIKDPYGGLVYDTQGAYIGMPGKNPDDTPFAPIVA